MGFMGIIYTDIEAVNVSDVLFTLRTNIVFTLTCVSTGGPATTVTWTRDNVTVTNGTETHYITSTQEYSHRLVVIERLEGLYTCTVANDRPSNDSANITVQGKILILWLPIYLLIDLQLLLLPPM